MKDDNKKPPIGLTPRYIHEQARVLDILEAMHRYAKVNEPIPNKWLDELQDIIDVKGE